MAYIATNFASSTLANSLGGTVDDVTLTIQSADISKFPVVNDNGVGTDWTTLVLTDNAGNKEIVKCTRHDTGVATFTIVRAQEGTAVRSWLATTTGVSLRFTAAAINTVLDEAQASADAAKASEDAAADSETAAAASELQAEYYATKTDGYAEATNNSAKSWAIGGTGAGQPTAGSAKDWAEKATSPDGTSSKSAKTWATEASTSAGNAATSESNALAYKNTAETQAGLAQGYATAAANSYDSFDDRYLGPKAADPTLDNDGNALLVGALYWSTSENCMKVYSGSVWNQAAPAPGTTFAYNQTFSGNGSTTSFTLSPTPAIPLQVHVFISGVRQVYTTDYSISGANLTFTSAPPTGTNNIYCTWSTPVAEVTAVTTGMLNDGAVTTSKITDSNVTAAKLAASCIDAATKIVDGIITWAKHAAMNTGKLIGRSTAGSGAPEEISIGTGLSLSGGTLSCTVTVPASNGEFRTIQAYTSAGSFTWTKPGGLTRVKVTVVGGGGGGGGEGAALGSSGSGGAGGASIKVIAAASLGATETVTVGSGGSGGTSAPTSGGSGGTSSFGAHCSATGGTGGTSGPAGTYGAGGSGSGGNINLVGSYGQGGVTANYFAGSGGASIFGGSGTGTLTGGGSGFHGGGGGATASSGGARAGGAGGAGVIIVEEYY